MTSTLSTQQLLQKEIETLPGNLMSEVLDFVQFLKEKWTEEAFLWEQVEKSNSYRRQHPDEVITMTVDEWLAETENRIDLD